LLSILIPVYNYSVGSLVNEIDKQCLASDIDYEIVVMEDGSTKHLTDNASLSSLPNVRYIYNQKNAGRAAIRNILADHAKFDWLLFLDCDSEIDQSYFIRRYLETKEVDVVYGGRKYLPQTDEDFLLHYTYGIEREAKDLNTRINDPHLHFQTNNFAIAKKVFQSVRFDESLTKYGFEDSLFAYDLKRHDITVVHIENPVVHAGLDRTDDFLQKSRQATENAWLLVQSGKIPAGEIRFTKKYSQIRKWQMQRPMAAVLSVYEPYFIAYLKKSEPKIIYLDFLKLLWSHRIVSNTDKK